jgi:hypothetical protein
MGSGRAIKEAIRKHGIDSFSKEILHVFETSEEMFAMERSIIQECLGDRNNYNMGVGGAGGFTSEIARRGALAQAEKYDLASKSEWGRKGIAAFHANPENISKLSENGRKGGRMNKGKKKSPEHIRAIQEAKLRKKNGAPGQTRTDN